MDVLLHYVEGDDHRAIGQVYIVGLELSFGNCATTSSSQTEWVNDEVDIISVVVSLILVSFVGIGAGADVDEDEVGTIASLVLLPPLSDLAGPSTVHPLDIAPIGVLDIYSMDQDRESGPILELDPLKGLSHVHVHVRDRDS